MKNFSSLVGYFLVFVFFYFAITKATDNPALFLNFEGIFIVGGGLLVAALASFPWSVLASAAKSVGKNVQSKQHISVHSASKLVELASLFQGQRSQFEKELDQLSDSFLKRSLNLTLEGIEKTTVIEILEIRIEEQRAEIQTHMNVMLTLSKYSPAMGLAATVLGLVNLLGQLQSANMAQLGLGMAIALSATFYGIILSNLIFAPLSELIATSGDFEVKEMEMIRDGVEAMMERKNPIVIGEIVNSFLPLQKQVNFSEKLRASA